MISYADYLASAKQGIAQANAQKQTPQASVYGSGGFNYDPTSGSRPMTPDVTRPLDKVKKNNTYQKQTFTPTPVNNSYSPSQQGLISALDAQKGDITNTLEGTLRQVASDKAFSQENSNLARNAAQNAYSTGTADTQNAYQKAIDANTRAGADEVAGLQNTINQYQNGFGMNEAMDALQRQDSNNKLTSRYAKLGTLAGSQYTDASQRYNTFADIASGQRRYDQNSQVADYLKQIANSQGFHGDEAARYAEAQGLGNRTLASQYQNELGGISTRQDAQDREAAIRNFQAENAARADVNTLGSESSKYLYQFGQDNQNQANNDRNFQFQNNQSALDNAYRDKALAAQNDPNSFDNQLRQAQITGQYNGAPTYQAQQASQAKAQANANQVYQMGQDQLAAKQKQQQIDIQQQQADTSMGKGSYTPAQTQQAQVGLLQYLKQFAPNANASGPSIPGHVAGAQQIDPAAIAQYIYSYAPGNTQAAVSLRQALANAASQKLQSYGINASIQATPTQQNAQGVVGEYQQAIALGYIDPTKTTLEQYIKSKAAASADPLQAYIAQKLAPKTSTGSGVNPNG